MDGEEEVGSAAYFLKDFLESLSHLYFRFWRIRFLRIPLVQTAIKAEEKVGNGGKKSGKKMAGRNPKMAGRNHRYSTTHARATTQLGDHYERRATNDGFVGRHTNRPTRIYP